MFFADSCANGGRFVQRIANSHGTYSCNELLDEDVPDVFVYEDPSSIRAHLQVQNKQSIVVIPSIDDISLIDVWCPEQEQDSKL